MIIENVSHICFKKTKQKVLMVSNHFYPSIGGLELQAKQLAQELIKMGHLVKVITPNYHSSPRREMVGTIPVERFSIIGSPHVKYGIFNKMYYAISLWICLLKNIKNYDIIHVHQALYAAFVCTIFSKVFRKKLIIKISGSGEYGNVNVLRSVFFGGEFMLTIMKHADAFVSLSGEIDQELVGTGFPLARIRSIPNGVEAVVNINLKQKRILKEKFGYSLNTFVCIFVGRLCVEKNIDMILRAWPIVISSQPNSMLLIVGDGPDADRLAELANLLGISDYVYFSGNRSDVSDLLNISDCFLLASKSEGMSNSLLEAMAHGLPSIVTNIPGNQAVIHDGIDGILIDIDDINSFASAIVKLIQNPSIADTIGNEARQTIARNYSLSSIAREYETLYREL